MKKNRWTTHLLRPEALLHLPVPVPDSIPAAAAAAAGVCGGGHGGCVVEASQVSP